MSPDTGQNSPAHDNAPRRRRFEIVLAVCVRQEIRLPKVLLLGSLEPRDQGLKTKYLLKNPLTTDSRALGPKTAEIRHL
jgi:hypothetical protein